MSDLSPDMAAVARRAHPDLTFDEGSMTALDLADGSLAGALAWYCLPHTPPELPDILQAEDLGRVHRPRAARLDPGGDVRHGVRVVDQPEPDRAAARPASLRGRLYDDDVGRLAGVQALDGTDRDGLAERAAQLGELTGVVDVRDLRCPAAAAAADADGGAGRALGGVAPCGYGGSYEDASGADADDRRGTLPIPPPDRTPVLPRRPVR
ncbi:class I SAM-dependent methyltransferase [Streptomyces sp. NPDC057908]|uniref:class I SAM-dependent methyltransferase n=1 Tax=Streptomyces sp. NPDC057908 TaxID=3346276 RepID=UPI0036EA4C39